MAKCPGGCSKFYFRKYSYLSSVLQLDGEGIVCKIHKIVARDELLDNAGVSDYANVSGYKNTEKP